MSLVGHKQTSMSSRWKSAHSRQRTQTTPQIHQRLTTLQCQWRGPSIASNLESRFAERSETLVADHAGRVSQRQDRKVRFTVEVYRGNVGQYLQSFWLDTGNPTGVYGDS